MNISCTVIQKTNKDVLKLTGCLAAIFKFISMTGIYFKYIMCCCFYWHCMLYRVVRRWREKKILVTACIAMYKVSWQWTLIILWIIRYHFYLAQEVQAYIQTCNLSPVFSPDRPKEDARKGKILQMWNHLIYDEEYFCEIGARFRQPYYMFDPL